MTGQVEPFPPAAPAAARLPVRMLIGVVVSTTLGFLAGLVALLVGLPEAPRWVAVVVAGAGLVVAAVVSGYLIRRVIALDRERETLDREFARLSRAAALGEIASGIAHDLNNPLAVMNEEVGWLTDLLATANVVPEPTRQEFANSLKQIGQQIRRAADFTRRVLDWARDAESGAMTPDVNALVVKTLYLLEGELAAGNVRVIRRLEPGLPAVAGSEKDLGQVLLHLMKNALDAMKAGSGTLSVSTAASDGMVRVTVADTGTGIPPELLGRIFEPFFTTKPEGAGTGLGLRISALIVRRAGGRIEVESTPGQGAIFRVVLPAVPVPALAARSGETHADHSTAARR